MGRARPGLEAALLAALLVVTAASRAQEEPRKPAGTPSRPAKKAPTRSPAREESPPSRDSVQEELLKINYIFNRQLYELAIPRYEKLLSENPGYARADLIHYALALSRYNLAVRGEEESPAGGARPAEAQAARVEQLKKAVAHFKEALKPKTLEPRMEATRLLGQSLLLLEDYDGAAKAFQFVLDRSPEPREAAAAALGLADCRFFKGDHAGAADAYRVAIEKGIDGAERERAEFQLAMSIYRSGDGGKESAALFAAIAARADGRHAADARYMQALSLEAAADAPGAIEAFRSAASGGGQYAEVAWLGLGTTLFRAGRHQEAAEELEKLLASHPRGERREQASLLLARSLAETRGANAAAKLLQELRSSPAVGDEASLWLARLYARNGKHRSAATILSAALKAFPKSALRADLELDLVTAQLSEGNYDDAERTLARLEAAASGTAAQGGGPAADNVAYLRAYALHRSKKYEESRAACAGFRSAHAGSQHLKDVALLEAENKLLLGDAAGAAEAYRAFIEMFGDRADGPTRLKASFRSAQALYLAKSYTEASRSLESLDPAAFGPDAEKAFREDPLFATHAYLLGECSYQLKGYDEAAKHFRLFLDGLAARNPATDAAEKSRKETSPPTAEAADARFKLAHSLQLQGKTAEARAAYLEALAADPGSPHAEQISFELGQIAIDAKDYPAAKKAFEDLLERNAGSRFAPNALRFLGWIAAEAKDHAAAAAHYRRLAGGFPEHALAAEAEIALARSLEAQGKGEEAREVLARFKKRRPDDPRLARVLFEEAASLARENRHQEALAALERVHAAGLPADLAPAALYEMAWCRRALGDPAAAAQAYDELIKLPDPGPLGDAARLELGELRFEAREYARAKEALEPLASRASPQREKALYRLAWCHHQLDDAAATIAVYNAFAKDHGASPLGPELALLAARAHLKEGDPAKAGALFQLVADSGREGPEVEAAALSLGECLAEDKKFGEARKRFEQFLERQPGSPLAYRARFGVGWCLENVGRLDDAVDRYRQVLKETTTPIAARAQFQIGQCLATNKQYKDAIVEFLQVPAGFDLPEWSAKALLQVAGCFEALDDRTQARKYYAEVATKYAERDEAKLARDRLERLDGQ